MMKILWKDKKYDKFVNSFYVFNFMPDISFGMCNPYKYGNIKTSIANLNTRIIDIVKLLFPEKKRDDIIKELKDKQLLLKLYKCFPDY